MSRVRPILTAVALAFVATAMLTPPAAADNCDIFINPEDCQNTGWTVGTIATLAGGVAVATAATLSGTPGSAKPPDPPKPSPPPPRGPDPRPLPPTPLPGLLRPQQGRRDDDDDSKIEGIEVRPTFDAPTITVAQRGNAARAHSVRLQVELGPGTQTASEVRRGTN